MEVYGLGLPSGSGRKVPRSLSRRHPAILGVAKYVFEAIEDSKTLVVRVPFCEDHLQGFSRGEGVSGISEQVGVSSAGI